MSYVGRVQLINVVLRSMHTCWCCVFILTKAVVQEIDKRCRNFLWKGTAEGGKRGVVASNRVCRPKSEGGLGIKETIPWNKASVGKLFRCEIC